MSTHAFLSQSLHVFHLPYAILMHDHKRSKICQHDTMPIACRWRTDGPQSLYDVGLARLIVVEGVCRCSPQQALSIKMDAERCNFCLIVRLVDLLRKLLPVYQWTHRTPTDVDVIVAGHLDPLVYCMNEPNKSFLKVTLLAHCSIVVDQTPPKHRSPCHECFGVASLELYRDVPIQR